LVRNDRPRTADIARRDDANSSRHTLVAVSAATGFAQPIRVKRTDPDASGCAPVVGSSQFPLGTYADT